MHWDLDGAWPEDILGLPRRDLRAWGPRLRYFAPAREIEAFDRFTREADGGEPPAPFALFGSGDFHHLSGLRVRRAAEWAAGRLNVVIFDNHPDWDVRPPRWGCGNWVNRALDLPAVEHVSVWGLGNFELSLPSRLFANRRALREGRLAVHPWAERQPPAVRRRFDCMTRDDWRGRFEQFAGGLRGNGNGDGPCSVYVSIDLDCLDAAEAVTNWENGLFRADDVAWAVGRLRHHATVIGGDICGAWSAPAYQRWGQRLVGWWDHPKLTPRSPADARQINAAALRTLWPALTGDSAAHFAGNSVPNAEKTEGQGRQSR